MSLSKKSSVNLLVILVITFSIVAIDIDNLTTRKSILGFFGIIMAIIAMYITHKK